MIKLIRTNSAHSGFISLVKELDAYLELVDGDEHEFYDQYNGIEDLHHVVVALHNDSAVACGAFKAFDTTSVELKRMYCHPDHRNTGIASQVLQELEKWASELQFQRCILETGKQQTEALSFYQKNHYRPIPNFGPYTGVANSFCFEKCLS
ncbi:MAG: GNAT family N-acetyltransferase [Flavobacteriales bacterium]|nr:GNAT family N-acetyltransferase [Flavobacteriales bacterium]